jgi:hypothetical protein
MFRKSSTQPQLDVFGSVPSLLEGAASKQFHDENHWHNKFYNHVISRIDETIFRVLFNETMGAPNAPISKLIGMMILKDAFGWSDAQLYEQCRFNLLTRAALGLFNINDSIPTESTYYLLRDRIYKHQLKTGEDLLEKTFDTITRGQIQEFDVDGRAIRMDSKLIGSNIAFFTRYEIVHQTLCQFYKTLDKASLMRLPASFQEQLKTIVSEESSKTVYRSTKEEIVSRLASYGGILYTLINTFSDHTSVQYRLLQRVFNEQYKVAENEQIEVRPKEEITSGSVQSPHDPDCAYRNKNETPVKGYSVNLTETISEDSLNLITNVTVKKANASDSEFVQPSITKTIEVSGQPVEKVYVDGAYQSPANDGFCEDMEMVFGGLQGAAPRYDLEMTDEGLLVTDTITGEIQQAVLSKPRKRSKEVRWRIKTVDGRYRYFNQKAIRASQLRRKIIETPSEERNKRNNVEATIFQLCYRLRKDKTRYRGMFKQQAWAYFRCIWINLLRIIGYLKQLCQRTGNTINNRVKNVLRYIYTFLSYLFQKYLFRHRIYFLLTN